MLPTVANVPALLRPLRKGLALTSHRIYATHRDDARAESRRRVGHRCSSAPLAVVPYGGVYAEGLSGRAANRRVEPHPHLPPELIALQAGGE